MIHTSFAPALSISEAKEKEQATLQCNATVTEGNTTEISGNPEIENSEKEEKKPKKEGEPEIKEIPSYFDDPVVNSMFFSYLEYRKEKGKEVKGKAIGYCIDKLESLSNSPVEQVAIIKQTIQNGWTGFFPLKGKKEKIIPASQFTYRRYGESAINLITN